MEAVMLTRRRLLFALSTLALGVNTGMAADGAYPVKTIRLIVPFPPGTNSEIAARIIADRLSAKFGQAVIIENRPGGAGGTVGAAAVANAEPDGYTLLVSPPGPLVTAGAIYKTLTYDPGTSFAPVALLFDSPQLLAVNASLPVKSVQDLVAYAKGNPWKVNFASPGHGTQPHLLGEMFKAVAEVSITHLPYKGPAAAVTDLLSGQVQMYFETAPLILPQAEAGKLRVVAVAAESRFAQLPDVPTTVESGFPTLVGGFWSGILAPAKTPALIVSQLNAAINEVMRSQEMQATLAKFGAQARVGTAQGFAAFIAAETRKWSAIIKAAGVQID
jgi:tripartite-type tricarboxylate transporter receptor subunit TctC